MVRRRRPRFRSVFVGFVPRNGETVAATADGLDRLERAFRVQLAAQAADEDLQHLTERFWRSSKSLGSGLGLAIVQAIVQSCAGNLILDSRSDGLRGFLQVPARSTGV